MTADTPIEGVGSTSADGQPLEEGAFTIYEHHARTRHFDLRLVLGKEVTAWAVASGVPAPGEVAQLAIRIDRPALIARAGAGSEPGGRPWDQGRMTVATWLEGEAAVVTLHGVHGGGLGGARTVSLQHVGSAWQDDDHWTIVALDERS